MALHVKLKIDFQNLSKFEIFRNFGCRSWISHKKILCNQRHFYYVANFEVAWYEFIPQNSSSWGNLDTKTSIWCHNSSNNAVRDFRKWTRHFFETRRAFCEFWWRFLAAWTAIISKISPNQLYFDIKCRSAYFLCSYQQNKYQRDN